MLPIPVTIPILPPRAWLVAKTGAGTTGVVRGENGHPFGLQGSVQGPAQGWLAQAASGSRQGKPFLSLGPFPESSALQGPAPPPPKAGDTDPPFPCEYQIPI